MSALQRIGLGTVQWGLPYGISNTNGRPGGDAVDLMLAAAAAAGIVTLDTAPAYGEAEAVLGHAHASERGFRIVTKTAVGDWGASTPEVTSSIFEQSLKALRCSSVDTLLVHHGANLLGETGSAVWLALQCLVKAGKTRRIGVSVYAPAELVAILELFSIDVVQLPYSIYDQRFALNGLLDRLKKKNIEVHVRSSFLQGVLLMPADELPPHFLSIAERQRDLHSRFSRAGLSPLQGALQFCLGDDRVDRVIVGCETLGQVQELIDAAKIGPISSQDWTTFAIDDEMVTLPTSWPKSSAERQNIQKGTSDV